jgi:DNA invertase Pin-like site-specific DNA recombinase|nr:MAG TPA: integrase [Caudoviricetes sp.]
MEKKVIAIIRTSTTQQEIDSQREEVLSMAIADGYSIDEIEVVGRAGASAIKVDEAYQENMNRVYELIDTIPTIQAVYAWAIDRIGRNEEILMKLKNTLIKKKIQLVIKNPSLRLLEANGDVNAGVELAFSLFATMAKQEMEQKKARFNRARKRNDEKGKYNGGYVAYGYMVKDGYIVINEEEAKIVRLIFTELASGKYSCDGLARELQDRGIKFKGRKMLFSNVRGILKNKIYCGEQLNTAGSVRNVPQIVSKELYVKAIAAISANNPSKTNSTTNRYCFGLRLIKCPYCGCHFSVAAKLYQCHNHNRNYYDSRQGFEKCPNGISIGAANLDRLLWYAAATVHFDYLKQLTGERDEEIDGKIEVLNQKIQHLQSMIDSLSDKRKRINLVFMDGDITKEDRDSRLSKLVRDNETYAVQIREYEEEIGKLTALKDGDVGDEIVFESFRSLMMLDDKELQCKIVRKHIKNIQLEKAEYAPYKRVLKITIQFYNHTDLQFLYLAKSLGEFFPIINGKVERDMDGKLKPIPNLKEWIKLIGKEVLTYYRMNPELIAAKEAGDKNALQYLKEKYGVSRRDMMFISKTATRFAIPTADAALGRLMDRLKAKGLIIPMDNAAIPI